MREGAKLQHKLVKVDKPVLRIPMLAIHLQKNLYQASLVVMLCICVLPHESVRLRCDVLPIEHGLSGQVPCRLGAKESLWFHCARCAE